MKTLNHKTLTWPVKSVVFIIVINILTPLDVTGQENKIDEIIKPYIEYSAPFREVAYCHLNKSTFIKGEMIGFSAYVFNKDSKKPSTKTKNLYCIVEDSAGNTIKEKLLKLENSFSNNVFSLDSTFTTGHYTFKAYTNWMNNFNETNAFIESFRVIDPEIEGATKDQNSNFILDAQFLPEGGHLVEGVKSTVGVIIKNARGFGLPNLEGTIYNSKEDIISTFKTNALGIGRFNIIPEANTSYSIKVNFDEEVFRFQLKDIKPKGISISVTNTEKNLAINLRTNQETFNDIKDKKYSLVIHDGNIAKGLEISFNNLERSIFIDNELLFSGINIITLLDEMNRPLLERLIFNFNGVDFLNVGSPQHVRVNDSINISIALDGVEEKSLDSLNISVSVLPEKTKSYKRHHNILSYVYLQPYVKGYIENAQYYFTEIDATKKYQLDNLLLTQGWSSYNWDKIFNKNFSRKHAFEDGIAIRAYKQNSNQQNFVFYPLKNNKELIINLPEDKDNFIVSNLYPEGLEALGIGAVNNKGKVKKPNFYLQYFPSKVPEHNLSISALNTQETPSNFINSEANFTLLNIKDTQVLDKVVLEVDVNDNRIKKLEGDAFSSYDIFDERKRAMNLTFANYVTYYIPNLVAKEYRGSLTLTSINSTSLPADPTEVLTGALSPIVYLDDQLIPDLNYFYGFDMSTVDYITYNRFGLAEGFLGAGGVIRIYTSLINKDNNNSNSFGQFNFPLTFAENKKFYAPKYDDYNDDFFENYGIVEWVPNTKLNDDGQINFTVYCPYNNNLRLFIEGVNLNGQYISAAKVVELNDSD